MQSQDIHNSQSSMSAPFYAEVQKLATQQHLGERQASFTETTVNGTRLVINAIVWFIVALIGLYFIIKSLPQLRGAISDSETLQSLGATALIGLAILGGCLLQSWRNLREYRYRHLEQLHIFEDGFVYLTGLVHVKGREKSYAVRWDSINILLRGTLDTKRTGHILYDRLSVTTDKDTLIYICPRLQQRMELCNLIERGYTGYRLPGMLELYKMGEELEFGDLALNNQGISRFINDGEDEEVLDWDEVAAVDVGDQFTYVYTKADPTGTPWLKVVTVDIENALLLKELIRHIFEQK
mgnify:CR=1 FL=1